MGAILVATPVCACLIVAAAVWPWAILVGVVVALLLLVFGCCAAAGGADYR